MFPQIGESLSKLESETKSQRDHPTGFPDARLWELQQVAAVTGVLSNTEDKVHLIPGAAPIFS